MQIVTPRKLIKTSPAAGCKVFIPVVCTKVKMEFSFNESTAENCFDHIDAFNRDLHPYQTLSLLVPTDDRVWTERNETWYILFKVATALLALGFLILGVSAVILVVKRECLVLTTRTFFAVYLSMAILGFSRAALLSLDPFGIIGFISEPFPAWIIISRFLGSLGFPSLVGACTLIILTLIKLVETKPGKQWYECWTYVLLITCIPYGISLAAESLGHINTYSALFSGLLCEVFFVIWGTSICIFYLIAGVRLLRKVNKAHRRATNQFTRNDRKMKRIKEKIVRITFSTAAAGIFYSLVSAGGVVMVLLLILSDCMGFRQQQTNSAAWLAVQFIIYLAELLLAICVFYSITDVSKLVHFFHDLFKCKLFTSRETVEQSESAVGEEGMQDPDPESGTYNNNVNENEANTDVAVEVSPPCGADAPLQPDIQLERFTMIVKKNSDSSLETVGPIELSIAAENIEEPKRGKKMTVSRSAAAIDKIVKDRLNRQDQKRGSLDTDIVSRIFSVNDSPPHVRTPSSHRQPKLFRSHHKLQSSAPSVVRGELEVDEERSKSPRRLRHWQSQAAPGDHAQKLSVDLKKAKQIPASFPSHLATPTSLSSLSSNYLELPPSPLHTPHPLTFTPLPPPSQLSASTPPADTAGQ